MKTPKLLNRLILTLALVLIATCASATAQVSENSIPDSGSKIVSRDQAISILVDEVKSARVLIAANDERINTLSQNLKSEEENSNSFSRSYEAAKSEITSLRVANDALKRAVASQEKTIALLQHDLDRERKSKKKWQKRTFKIGATLAVIVLTQVL